MDFWFVSGALGPGLYKGPTVGRNPFCFVSQSTGLVGFYLLTFLFQFSDLLSRHVNKCHASEKPLPSTGSTRRKGSASASRATTSKQACDQCVQSSLPCDGCNPCCEFSLSIHIDSFFLIVFISFFLAKCVQRKCRCTYVKFHRQTAPTGPGHHSARPAAAAAHNPTFSMSTSLASSSGLGGLGSSLPLSTGPSGSSSSRIPLYHPTMGADGDFILGPPPPLPGPSSHQHHGHGHGHGAAPSTTRGNNGIPTMAETLYGSNSFDFPALYPPSTGSGTAGSVGSTSSDGGDVDSEYVAAKYRAQAQAELFGPGRTGMGYESLRPSSSTAAAPAAASSAVTGNNNNPQPWMGWDQHSHSHQNSLRQSDAFPQQHSHSGSQRITSHPVDLSVSDGSLVGGGGGGGGLGIGVGTGAGAVGSSLHGNHFYVPSVRYT